MRAAAVCQSLPHVNGPTVSEYYGLIRLPGRPSASLLVLSAPPTCVPPRSLQGLSSSRRFSPRIPRSLWTPADPRCAHQCARSVLASGPLTPSPSAFEAFASYALYRGYIKLGGVRSPLRATWFPVYASIVSFGSVPGVGRFFWPARFLSVSGRVPQLAEPWTT